MPNHDVLLGHMVRRGWQVTSFIPPTKEPHTGWATAYRDTPASRTRVRWILKQTPSGLSCQHPNYTVHKR